MKKTLQRDLSAALSEVVGRPCWEFVAGKGTGSNFTMDFGRKLKRARPLTNPHLSDAAKRYVGEYVLYVTCPWRLQTRSTTVTSWADARKNRRGVQNNLGLMLAGLAQLKGARVSHVALRGPALDLRVTFDNGLSLVVFSDETEATGYPAYNFYTSQTSYSVLGSGLVESEPRFSGS